MIDVVEQSAAHQAWTPVSEADRAFVRDHLEQLLRHPLFSHSKRLPAFLRFVVHESLQSPDSSPIKERTIGIMAFGRAADYDTNLDPVVRITAGEVRKKLAQYYYDTDHTPELRIELQPGSYLPRFRRQPQIFQPESRAVSIEVPIPIADLPVPVLLEPAQVIPVSAPTRSTRWIWMASAVLVLCAIGLGIATWRIFFHQSDTDRFWFSLANPSHGVLIVLPTINSSIPQADQDPASRDYKFEAESVALEDAAVAANVAGQMQLRHVNSQLAFSKKVSLSDLRGGPAVLVGALDNAWTMRSVKSLPYIFERSEDRRYGRIVDTTDQGRRLWTTDFAIPNVKIQSDYGIVALYKDSLTDQRVLMLAGISAEGTFAAGEAVANPEYLKVFLDAGAKSAKNFEAVIQTQTVDGKSGPPHIVAFKSW